MSCIKPMNFLLLQNNHSIRQGSFCLEVKQH